MKKYQILTGIFIMLVHVGLGQSIEIIDVNDMGAFGDDISTPVMQKVAAEFQQFADNPCFILTEDL